jgi:hypothetical protein
MCCDVIKFTTSMKPVHPFSWGFLLVPLQTFQILKCISDNGSTSMRSFSFCFFFHRSYYILKKLKENILLFFCLLACSYTSLWFCFSFSHCQDKDDSDDSLTTQAFTESGFSLHPVCLSSQDDVVVFFVSHFSSGFVLLQKISIQQ